MLGKLAYLARFNQSHHSICERHENSPAEESDFQDRGFVGHPINVARWIFTCLLSSRHRSQWGSQDALLLSCHTAPMSFDQSWLVLRSLGPARIRANANLLKTTFQACRLQAADTR